MADEKFIKGVGLDLGTNAIVRARLDSEIEVTTSWIRDAFLTLRPANSIVRGTMKKSLDRAGVQYLDNGKEFIVLGDDALNQSVERGLTTQRPMSKGVISPRETQALPMFKVLIEKVLGKPVHEEEICVYSVPASPVDQPFDSAYHSHVINSILKNLGYKGVPLNEAQAIVYSELEEEDYTGLTISFGAGMVNICVSNAGDPIAVFATSKSGDYVDTQTATALGYHPDDGNKNLITPSTVQLTKETCDLDLTNPDEEDRIQLALVTYYEALINYTVDSIIYQLNKLDNPPRFTNPIVMIISGGTSKPKGFVSLFRECLNKKSSELPFEVKEVRHAKEPLDAVARGCLIAAQLEYPEE